MDGMCYGRRVEHKQPYHLSDGYDLAFTVDAVTPTDDTRSLMPGEVVAITRDGWEFLVEFDAAGRMVGFAVQAPRSWEWNADEVGRVVPPGGLTARMVHSLSVGAIETAARRVLRRRRAELVDDAVAVVQFVDAAGEVVSRTPLPRNGGIGSDLHQWAVDHLAAAGSGQRARVRTSAFTDEELARYAQLYSDCVEAERSQRGGGSPMVRFSEHLGTSRERAQTLRRLAVRRGLLTAPPNNSTGPRGGRAGGELTAKALAILALASPPAP